MGGESGSHDCRRDSMSTASVENDRREVKLDVASYVSDESETRGKSHYGVDLSSRDESPFLDSRSRSFSPGQSSELSSPRASSSRTPSPSPTVVIVKQYDEEMRRKQGSCNCAANIITKPIRRVLSAV